MKRENFGSVVKLALILGAVALIATLILTVCNSVTQGKIAMLSAQAQEEARKAVLSAADSFEELTASYDSPVKTVYRGLQGADTVGYCVSVAPNGYGGKIEMMVGVDLDGKVTDVSITDMSETPGLGARAKEEAFYGQYAGKSGEIKVIKSGTAGKSEVNAISGATITSKAVTAGVNAALETVGNLKGGN